MTPHDARLMPAAGVAWLAVASEWLGWGWWVLAVAGAGLGVGLARRSARPAMVLAVAAGLAGWCGGTAAVSAAAPVKEAVGTRATMVATAASDAMPGTAGPTQGLWRVELSVANVDDVATRSRVVVWGREEWSATVRGEALVVEGTLSQALGGADALMWRPSIVARDGPHGLDAAIASLRSGFREATGTLPERLRPLTRGMVIGDDSGMEAPQRAQMSAAGLTHLTAVSGSHFAIVLVAVTALLRVFVRSRRARAAATGAAMALLVCLVFPEPSVVRAATMAAMICAALWWGRPAHAIPALSAGVIAVSVMDPRLACEPGFAMSVAAVSAIALWAPPLAVRLERSMPALLAHPLAVCIAAQCAVLPLLALIGGGAGPWSVAANLAVGWCAAPVTLSGLAAVIVAPVSPGAAHMLGTASGWCAWPVDAAARAAAALPGAELMVPPGPVGAAASGIVVGVAVALTFATRLRLGMPVLAGVAVLAAVAIPLLPRLLAPATPGNWLVVSCDVGQGDAMLLRSGQHAAVMIDVGPEHGTGPACLERYGVRSIDLLIITHPHADHEGALPEVLASVDVAAAWISPSEPGGTEREFAREGIPVVVARAGTTATVGEVNLTVLAPTGDAAGTDATELNDASIVVLATVDSISVLALGDLEHEGQRELARALSTLVVDLVKIPHHGSDRQEEVLAELVSARVGVVSVGAGNTYGHPAPDGLRLWGSRVGTLLRTDQCGDVVITAGPGLATACPGGMEN